MPHTNSEDFFELHKNANVFAYYTDKINVEATIIFLVCKTKSTFLQNLSNIFDPM